VPGINVIADQNDSPVVVLKILRVYEVNLSGLEAVAIADDLQQCRTRAVGGRCKYIRPSNYRIGDVCDVVGDIVVTPEETSRLGVGADNAAADE